MAQMEAPQQAQAQEAEDEQAGPLLLERLQVSCERGVLANGHISKPSLPDILFKI